MPRLRKRTALGRRRFDDDDRCFLIMGMCLSRDHESYDYWRLPVSEFPADVLENFSHAWEHFRDEIMADVPVDSQWVGKRPWGWWAFDAAEHRNDDENECDQLERLGALLDGELERVEQSDHGPVNGFGYESYAQPFRRTWHWWRFRAPERRDTSITEAEQLVRMGLDGLNERERHILANHRDKPEEMKSRRLAETYTAHLVLDDDERAFLGLPSCEVAGAEMAWLPLDMVATDHATDQD